MGGTLDDALGEAYDKAARLLGLTVGGGGGPAVEALAEKGDPKAFVLPVPMQAKKDCNFSFAGLKNAFRLAVMSSIQKHQEEKAVLGQNGDGNEEGEGGSTAEKCGASLPEEVKADLAASFQHTAIKHLEDRVARAMDTMGRMYPPASGVEEGEGEGEGMGQDVGQSEARALAVVGGVAANREIRRRLQALCDSRPTPWTIVVPPAKLCTDNGVMVAWAGVERIRAGMQNNPQGQGVYARLPLGRTVEDAAQETERIGRVTTLGKC
ncbi:unnamed protein product [Discosporangium mesarthrocarpum]